MRAAELFSREQADQINEHEKNMVRVLTPLAKMFTGKQVVEVLS